ncbi:MAG: PIN/TRAM domain-containing protein [Acidobacteriota bacterium]
MHGPVLDAALGLLMAAVVVGLHRSVSRLPLRTVLGGTAGFLAGGLVVRLLWPFWPEAGPGGQGRWLVALALLYATTAVGGTKGATFRLDGVKNAWCGEAPRVASKIVDTSVIIDGRLNDVAETGFLDGQLLVPQFVLRELQQVADSSDPLKRARGRKGLESLNSMKKLPQIRIEVTQMDFPAIPDVDMKLIELAQRTGGKIITNDFNLNKVARVRDVPVLNINDLANALKPVVLPGEPMRVFIIKEGKEPNQGVAYLDDGTMVVVDDGKPLVGQKVNIVITSVLQTTAGKMFFGRCDLSAPSGAMERRRAAT